MRLSVCFAGLFPVFPAFLSLPAFSIPPSKTCTHIKSMGTAVYRPKAPTFTPSPYSFRGCVREGNEAVYTYQLVEIQTPPTLGKRAPLHA